MLCVHWCCDTKKPFYFLHLRFVHWDIYGENCIINQNGYASFSWIRNKTATVSAGLLKHPRFLVTTKHQSVKDFCYIHLDRDTEWGDTHTNTYTVTDEKLILIHRTNNLQYNIIFLPTKMIMTYVACPSQCMNLGLAGT